MAIESLVVEGQKSWTSVSLRRENEPEGMQEAHRRFLEAAEALDGPSYGRGSISMDMVGERLGIKDISQLEKTTTDLFKGGYLHQDPDPSEAGMFRLAAKVRIAVLQRRDRL